MTLTELRDAWIAAEAARVAAYKAMLDTHRNSPEAIALANADAIEKRAKDAYANALQRTDSGDGR